MKITEKIAEWFLNRDMYTMFLLFASDRQVKRMNKALDKIEKMRNQSS